MSETPQITRELAKSLIHDLKLMRVYDSPFQFMTPTQVHTIRGITKTLIEKELFRSPEPENILIRNNYYIKVIQNEFLEIENSKKQFEDPTSSLEVLIKTAPSSVRMVIDFLSSARKDTRTDSQLMFPNIKFKKLDCKMAPRLYT